MLLDIYSIDDSNRDNQKWAICGDCLQNNCIKLTVMFNGETWKTDQPLDGAWV